MENLKIYEQVRAVPAEAQKEIKGGRLAGYTDINPMWRIKKLTELYGPCGLGWKYDIIEKRLEQSPTGEVAAFVDIDLQVKNNGEWSERIPGTGGSMFVAKEKGGMYCDDDCFKKALTDALSVACKALGVGADIYFKADKSKYDIEGQVPKPTTELTAEQKDRIAKYGIDLNKVASYFNVPRANLTSEQIDEAIRLKEAELSRLAKEEMEI